LFGNLSCFFCYLEMEKVKDEAEKFLQGRNSTGDVLFVMVTGSQAYGLAEENSSDVDYLGVYLAPSRYCVRFHQRVDKF
jgi:predicted nucleotidyltransferase